MSGESGERVQHTALDLFAGAGGLSLGLHHAGFRMLGAADSWKPAVDTYRSNFDHPVLQTDLSKVTAAELRDALSIGDQAISVVAGGPPCQGFSIQRIGTDDDDRNHLVLQFAELVLGLSPTAFVMENVPGLLGRRGRRLAAAMEDLMREGGYVVETRMINAADFGVPQIRRRVFMIGLRKGHRGPFEWPAPTHAEGAYRTVWDAIRDLPPATAEPVDPLHRKTRLSELNLRRLRLIPPGGGFEDLPPALRVPAHRNGAARIGHRNVYGRLAPDKPAVTITARFDSFTRGKFAHPHLHRNITLREGARLQTFPDDFLFSGSQEEIAALIGNAVPPLLARKVGEALMSALRNRARTPVSSPSQLRLGFSRGGDGDAGNTGDLGRIASSDVSPPA